MSSGCGDVLSLADLQTAKKHQTFEAEVITGKQGGVAGGADIDYATNQVTGQVQKTLPAVLRDAGFVTASFDFTSGGTLGVNDRNKVVLWPVSGGGDGNYYAWKGALPKTIPAASSPSSTGGISAAGWQPVTDTQLRTDLASYDSTKGDALLAVLRPESTAARRTQHQKNLDVLNVKDFGAIGDGNDNPLSSKFASLAAAQAVFPFVTALTQTQDYAAIQAAINAAKALNASVFMPSGQYITNTTITADYAVSMYGEGGQGLRDVSTTNHLPSPVRGTVIKSKVTTGRTLAIAPAKFCFGLTLRDFAIWGVQGQCDSGLYLHNVGWTGIVSGINVQYFPNYGLEIGYIQDTYFNNCSVLQCGNVNKYAVHCVLDSNYVYFNGCHFELSAYLLKLNTAWFWSWNQCHFEVARPSGDGVTDNDRFYYTAACVDLGSSYQLSFSNNTFVPVDVAYLATKLSVARDAVPYFMTSSGPYISFHGDTWLAPEGSVDIGYFTGTNTKFSGCKFVSLSPSRMSLYAAGASVSGCSFGIAVEADTTRLFGFQVQTGCASGNNIGFIGTPGTTKRTSGFLAGGAATFTGNEYPNSVIVNKYLDNAATVNGFDGKNPTYANIGASGDIDLTNYHPATQLRVNANAVTITHIYGAPLGRDVVVTTNNPSTVINYSSDNLLTQGAVNFSLPQYRTALFKSLNAGTPVLQQIG